MGELIRKNFYGYNVFSLSSDEIKELDKQLEENKKLLVSHVGDGEYECNVFGNIYSSYSAALRDIEKDNPGVEIVRFGENRYYICSVFQYPQNSVPSIEEIAFLTEEEVIGKNKND